MESVKINLPFVWINLQISNRLCRDGHLGPMVPCLPYGDGTILTGRYVLWKLGRPVYLSWTVRGCRLCARLWLSSINVYSFSTPGGGWSGGAGL